MAYHKSKSNAGVKADTYQIITDRIVSLLEQGEIPWRKTWNTKTGTPRNYITDKPYQGINILILASMRYSSPYWLTFKQAIDKGGSVRKGEHGVPIVFWHFKECEELDKAGKPKKIPYLRYYTVFNASQIDGIEFPEPAIETIDFNPIARAEEIVAGYMGKPEIKYGFTRACYRPPLDEVNMPAPERFSSAEEHYSTLFHELVHSTGHEKRLTRRGSDEVRHFGDENYSKEELVAEMGATFLNSEAGIEAPTLENSVAYIQSWLKALKNDPKILIQAASLAQKAADYILGRLSTSCEAAEGGAA